MNNSIVSALLNNGFSTMHTNISEVSFLIKECKDMLDIVMIVDGESDNMSLEFYDNIVKQVKARFRDLGKASKFTGFILCTNLQDVAPICQNEGVGDRRYAVLRESEEIVLFEFQDRRIDEHIEIIEKWRENPIGETMVKREKKKLRMPVDITLFNVLIIIVNIIVFAVLELGGSTQDPIYLEKMGGLIWSRVINNSEYYRLLTAMFMHAGIEHLASNMFALLFIGSYLEKAVGHVKYLLIYFTSGILAGVTSVLYNMRSGNEIVCVGASGAIFGVIGAMIAVLLLGNSKKMRQDMTRLLAYAFICILAGMTSLDIDNSAHIGGCISGFICAFALLKMYPVSNENNKS